MYIRKYHICICMFDINCEMVFPWIFHKLNKFHIETPVICCLFDDNRQPVDINFSLLMAMCACVFILLHRERSFPLHVTLIESRKPTRYQWKWLKIALLYNLQKKTYAFEWKMITLELKLYSIDKLIWNIFFLQKKT